MKRFGIVLLALVATGQAALAQYVEPREGVQNKKDTAATYKKQPLAPQRNDYAAYDRFFYVSLDVNKPLTNTNWIGDVSALGVKLGFRKMINQRFSAGFDGNWATYHQYQEPVTIMTSSGAVHTDYFKYVYTYGLTVTGQFYLKPVDGSSKILPYVGLGLGAANHEFVVFYNIYRDSESKWGFIARPEAGVLFPFSRKIGVMAAIHYDYATSKPESYDYNGFSNVGLQVGLLFVTR